MLQKSFIQNHNDTNTDFSVRYDQTISDFFNRRYLEFNKFLEYLPDAYLGNFLSHVINSTSKKVSMAEHLILLERIRRNPRFKNLIDSVIPIQPQAIPIFLTHDIKTRAYISLIDHPKTQNLEVDYILRIYDEQGKLAYESDRTIFAGQTHTLEPSTIGAVTKSKMKFGQMRIETFAKNFGSLRVYAQWYGNHYVTTTHERSALRKMGVQHVLPSLPTSPYIVTYLCLSNLIQKKINSDVCFFNESGIPFTNQISFSIPAMGTIFFSPTENLQGFFDFSHTHNITTQINTSEPGCLAVYYFVLNKRSGSWTIQHP